MKFDFVQIDTRKKKGDKQAIFYYLLLAKILGILTCIVGAFGFYIKNPIVVSIFLGLFLLTSIILALSVKLYKLINLSILFIILCFIFLPCIGLGDFLNKKFEILTKEFSIQQEIPLYIFGFIYVAIALIFSNICTKFSYITRFSLFDFSSLLLLLASVDFGFLNGVIDGFIFNYVSIKFGLIFLAISILALSFLIFNPKSYE